MKNKRNFRSHKVLSIFVLIFQSALSYSQSGDFPNVTKDLVPSTDTYVNAKHRLTLPGVWGLGIKAEYLKVPYGYASVEAGYGWSIAKHELDFDKKWRTWFEASVGYPVLHFQTKKTGRWITGMSQVGDIIDQEYYRIKVPSHHYFIVHGGFSLNPAPIKIYPGPGAGTGAVNYFTFLFPTYSTGITWKVIAYSDVQVVDSESGAKISGTVNRQFEMSFGLIIPAKDQLSPPDPNWKPVSKTDKVGAYYKFQFPYALNGAATFDIGISSLGYHDAAQLYLGNTFVF